MIPLRLVIDMNVVVSAALQPEGLQRTVILLAMSKPVHWYVSDPILLEYDLVLARPELKIRGNLRRQLLQWIRNHVRVIISPPLPQVTSDPADNIFIECADAARADYLVTGNQRHFPRFWKNTKIINSKEFLAVVAPPPGPAVSPTPSLWPAPAVKRRDSVSVRYQPAAENN